MGISITVNRKPDSELARLSTYGAQETVNYLIIVFRYFDMRIAFGDVELHAGHQGSESEC
jgi:hypothetical protein